MTERVDFVGGGRNGGVYIGQDANFRFQIFKRDGTTIEDVSAFTDVTFTVRKALGDADPPLIEKTKSAGEITVKAADPTNFPEEVAGANSVLEVVVTDVDTNLLSPGFYAYDIKHMDAGSEVPLTIGTIEALQAVTL